VRLLFAAEYYPLTGPGVFRVHDFARFMGSFGVKVSVVSRMGFGELSRTKIVEKIGDVRVYRAPTLDLTLAYVVLDAFQIATTFLACCLAILLDGIDIVIISVPLGVPGVGAFFAAKALRRKVVFDVRDKWEEYVISNSKYMVARCTHIVLKKLYDVLYKQADLSISVTPSLVKYIQKRGSPRVEFIPNGADAGLFHPEEPQERVALRSELGLHEGDVALVYAGAIGGYYRIDIVIRAIQYLMKTESESMIRFIIMGKGEPLRIMGMLKLTKELGLEDRVTYLGEREKQDVARIVSCCDLGVVPYDDNALWQAAYSTKFFEYCAAGLPVIATVTKDSDLGMLINGHMIGYVTDPLNIEQFAQALREFYDLNEAERNKMGARARKLVIESFDRAKTAKRLMETLQEVAR
jgi:glycosyltransferase involved in cell wall biosynthesis